jgi:dUTP pyrophosphatase
MPETVEILILRLPHGAGLELPAPQSAGAAGADLRAAIDAGDEIEIAPGGRALVPCGFALALPEGFEGQVRPRSGLAMQHGVTVLNAPGTIDADYRGEVKAILVNLGDAAFIVRRGDRIAQLIVAPVTRFALHEAETLPPTERGAGGFGSTGHRA